MHPIAILLGLICATICAIVASNKGRNAVGWFFLGFFFGIFSLIAVCIASDVKARVQKELALANENRRLQEQVHQERIKLQQFQTHAQQRLDTHDQILNVDTRQTLTPSDEVLAPLLETGTDSVIPSETIPPVVDASPVDPAQEQGWYYQEGESAVGPMDRHALMSHLSQGIISTTTNVWHASIKEWCPAQQVDGLHNGDSA